MSQEASVETGEATETEAELYKGALYGIRLDRSQAGVLIGKKEDSDIGKIAEDASKNSDLVVVRHGILHELVELEVCKRAGLNVHPYRGNPCHQLAVEFAKRYEEERKAEIKGE